MIIAVSVIKYKVYFSPIRNVVYSIRPLVDKNLTETFYSGNIPKHSNGLLYININDTYLNKIIRSIKNYTSFPIHAPYVKEEILPAVDRYILYSTVIKKYTEK